MSEIPIDEALLHGAVSMQKPHRIDTDRGYYLVHPQYLDYNGLREKKYIFYEDNGSKYYAEIEIEPYIAGLFKINFRVVHSQTNVPAHICRARDEYFGSYTRVRINANNWPINAIADINNARAELQSHGYINAVFVLVAPSSVLARLEANITNTDVSYRQFLLQNGLLGSTQVSENEDVILTMCALAADLHAGGSFIGKRGEGRVTRRGRFSDEVTKKAWKLLEEYMEPNQYFAFMEKTTIELENGENTFRLLINKDGKFTILEGKRGAGIVASSGRIKSYGYPLGDEIAVFIDWFRYKPKELIAQWNCGTYGIVKEGQRR